MADIKKIAEELVNLSVKDVSELANILKDEYGIEPAAATTVAVAGGAAGEAETQAARPWGLTGENLPTVIGRSPENDWERWLVQE